MKILKRVLIALIIIAAITVATVCIAYNKMISPIDKKNNTSIVVEIPSGSSSKQIANILKDKELIRNSEFFVFYLKVYKVNDIKASTYELNKSMSMPDIVKTLRDGNSYNPNQISITFQEGWNMRKIATVIESKTNNTYDDVMKKVTDMGYIDTLIKNYWFITEDVKNKDIYYPLEGYLFPDTYTFNNADVTVEEIFAKLLKQTDVVLSKYKDKMLSMNITAHEVLTFASIVELESSSVKDRPTVASVFYNRIKKGISLGSDVTTCYAQKFDDTALCHKQANFNLASPYNTRVLSLKGLPVGPIANPSETSIDAVLNPTTTDYFYFVADKYTNMYFFKTQSEFSTKIAQLKKEGAWL